MCNELYYIKKQYNDMSRNYGVGSRCMNSAGVLIINKSSLSFSSKATLKTRWGQFYNYAKEKNVKKLENIDESLVIDYGLFLQNRVDDETLSIATAHNYISVINTVMRLVNNNWVLISATQQCHIAKRNRISIKNKGISDEDHNKVKKNVSSRLSSIIDLERYMGLRFKESSLINAKKTLETSLNNSTVEISKGTKGGRKRNIPVTQKIIDVLKVAANIQDGNSMVQKDLSYKHFMSKCYSEITNLDFNFHGERHYYAQSRYEEITEAPAPIVAGWKRNERIGKLSIYLSINTIDANILDKKARLIIAEELGHGREEISNVYLG